MKHADTIFAVASGAGKSAIKIFRISGPETRFVADRLGLGSLQPRRAMLRRIFDPESGSEIDCGLAIWFPAPGSFTGEDCLELQVHGGRAIEVCLSKVLGRLPGCRAAEPGEFAWRAFSSGKLDLTEVEGLADLIDADTDLQRKQALGQAEGALYRAAAGWRGDLLHCLATVEGEIDFEDEDGVPKGVAPKILEKVAEILCELRCAAASFERAEVLKSGFCVVVLGPPNAGKSSLVNALAKRDAAIVSPTPGTTRDLIEITMDLGGVPVVLVDTAGLREEAEFVEQIGIERAIERANKAQLVLWLSSCLAEDPPSEMKFEAPLILVRSKADLCNEQLPDKSISVVTGIGLTGLLDDIEVRARAYFESDKPPLATNARHMSAVVASTIALEVLEEGVSDLELVAEELRNAARNLEILFGRIDSEEVLSDIFARFCVGK